MFQFTTIPELARKILLDPGPKWDHFREVFQLKDDERRLALVHGLLRDVEAYAKNGLFRTAALRERYEGDMRALAQALTQAKLL